MTRIASAANSVSRIEWGTIPDWIAAVGTAGALFVGLLLLGRQMSAFESSEQDRRAKHAYNVGAWWEPVTGGQVARFFLRNANPTPVYDCLILLRAKSKPLGVAILSISIPVVKPNDQVSEDRDASEVHPDDLRGARVELGFTDSDGRHWLRTRDGSLTELPMPMRSC